MELRVNSQAIRSILLGCVAAALLAAEHADGGQASASFRVTVNYTPSQQCTAGLGPDGLPAAECGSGGQIPGGGGQPPSGGTPPPAQQPAQSQAWPRSRLAGQRQGQDGYFIGEYSSRIIVAGEYEYVEMTVSW